MVWTVRGFEGERRVTVLGRHDAHDRLHVEKELTRLDPLALRLRHERGARALVAQPVELVDDDPRKELDQDETARQDEELRGMR